MKKLPPDLRQNFNIKPRIRAVLIIRELDVFFKAVTFGVTFFVWGGCAVTYYDVIECTVLRLVIVAAAIYIAFDMRVNHG